MDSSQPPLTLSYITDMLFASHKDRLAAFLLLHKILSVIFCAKKKRGGESSWVGGRVRWQWMDNKVMTAVVVKQLKKRDLLSLLE